MPYYTPLRYPGGKRRLASTVMGLLEANGLRDVEYVEPYAGGAAVALALLMEEYASVIHINDLSRAVYAFWHSVLMSAEELCNKIASVDVSMTSWEKQREVYLDREKADLLDLGFATLFLNRTNRSGILSGGVIGGKLQLGVWGIDARFNKTELITRIKRIGRYRNRIKLYQLDALQFTNDCLSRISSNSFCFYDPPYIENGKDLYLNRYTIADHQFLAKELSKTERAWIVTYDYSAIKHEIHVDRRRVVYDLSYTAQSRYQGREVMFFSDNLDVPNPQQLLGPKVKLDLERSSNFHE